MSFLSGKMTSHQKAEIHKGRREDHRRTCMRTQFISKNKEMKLVKVNGFDLKNNCFTAFWELADTKHAFLLLI